MKTYGKTIFTLAVGLTLLAQLAIPSPVYADDGTLPPPQEAETEVAPPEEPAESSVQPDESATEAAPAEFPVATEVPTEDAPIADPVEAESTSVPAEEPTVAEILQEIPESTDVVVLDESNQPLPLATQEAAEIIVTSDPIWCPSGVNPGGVGCSPSYLYFTLENDGVTPGGLIGWLNNPVNAFTVSRAGKIWIANSYNSALESSIDINGSSVAGTMENFALTLQGGWDGAFNSLGTITATNSVFSVPILITNWTGAVAVNNITVNGATTGFHGLNIQTLGNIELRDVTSNNNTNGHGAYLINDAGTGNVTLTGTNTFNSNVAFGLFIWSAGAITLSNITATANRWDGAHLNNGFSPSNASVTLNGNNTFNSNGEDGLDILSAGAITVSNITATANGRIGAYLHNEHSLDNASVTLNGTNTFTGNNNSGLYVLSNGNITANNVTANSSVAGRGVDLNNTSGVGSISLTGSNVFTGNKTDGLYLQSNGDITLNSITASGNTTGYGTYLNNTTSSSNATVTLNGTNTFTGNNNSGLFVLSDGNITTNDINSYSNASHGVWLDNRSGAGWVTMTGTNEFSYSGANEGLVVYSNGNITVANVTARNNSSRGTWLDNSSGTGNITLSGANVFNGNVATGLCVYSKGSITLENVTVSGNSGGTHLDNTFSTSNASVTLNGTNIFTDNGYWGLYVLSDGYITANNLTASSNSPEYGSYLDNTSSTSNAAVTLSGTNTFTGNGNSGLYILSDGNIIVNNITANGNTNYGIYINNTTGTKNVTLNGVTASGNGVCNIYVNGVCYDASADSNSTQAVTTTPTVIEVTTTAPEEFTLDCLRQDSYPVNLPNGDQVQIVCPVSGKASIKRLDNTMLPDDLPASYTYSSAFSLDIFQKDKPISFIGEGGHIRASFQIPSLQAGEAYSVLYWDKDNDKWVPLKDFMLDENGKARKFSLHTDDPRVTLSGLKFDITGDSSRVEVTTNFPGIFVLAQR